MNFQDKTKDELIKELQKLQLKYDTLKASHLKDIAEHKQAEKKLFLSEQKNRAWLENSPVCTKIVDLDFNLQFMSRAGIKGLQIDDITPYYGKPYPFHFYPVAFKTKMTGNMIKAIETGAVITQEAPVVDINGNEVWFHSTIIPVKDTKGTIDYLLIVSMDTTERKKFESDLIASEENLSVITSNTPDHIIVADNQLRYTYVVNPQLGLTEEQYIGKSDFEIGFSETDAIHLTSIKRKVLETGKPLQVEVPLKNKSGNTEYFDGSFIPRFDSEGKTNGLLGYFRNVTIQRNAEESFRKSEAKYNTIVTLSPAGIYLTDENGKCTYVNELWCKMAGMKPEEAYGDGWVKAIHPDDRTQIFEKWKYYVSKGSDWSCNYRIIDKIGKVSWVYGLSRPITDSSGKTTGFIGINSDITEVERVQSELEKSVHDLRALASHINEVREEDRARIARDLHDDLGQKLTALNMDISWIRSRIGVQSRNVGNKLEQMVTLINETIDSVQRISYGLRPSVLDDLGLCPALKWQVTDFHKTSGISCSISCSPKEIEVDAVTSLAVFRIVQEALTNIARHSGASGVSIKINLTADNLEIYVKDNGSGITAEKIESSKSFGLIGMRERVRVVGGEVNITGRKGEGTRVEVVIPVGKKVIQ